MPLLFGNVLKLSLRVLGITKKRVLVGYIIPHVS